MGETHENVFPGAQYKKNLLHCCIHCYIVNQCFSQCYVYYIKSFKISIRCKRSTTLDASVEDFRLSSDSLLHLINHNTIQWYSRWNTSNLVLSEEKRTKIWSILMSSQDAMILLYPAMSSCGDPASARSNTFTIFPIKVNDVAIKI